MKNNRNSLLLFILLSIMIATVTKADNNINTGDNYNFSEKFIELQDIVAEISDQYTAITSKLDSIQHELPNELENRIMERIAKDQETGVKKQYYSMMEIFSEDERDSLIRAGYATIEQFNALADYVFNLESKLQALSNTVSGISSQIPTINSTIQSLVNACGSLNNNLQTLNSVIEVKQDGSVVLCKSSPLIGKIEPPGGASFWIPAVYSEWDRAGSKFHVSHDSQIESVTLYCDDVNKILLPQNVYISGCESSNNPDFFHIVNYNATLINTSNFPRITYSFSTPVPILADRDYLLCVKRTGNTPLYVYTCSNVRNGWFYKPYEALESFNPPEPRGGGNDSNSDGDNGSTEPPRSGWSPQQWFDYYLSGYWSESVYPTQEIWSIFKFTDDVSFEFSSEGLDIEKGNITVEGAEVATSANLSGMITNILMRTPNLLNEKITWNHFCNNLKDFLITADGGEVIGELQVSRLTVPTGGNWHIGTTSTRTDIIIDNPNGRITTLNGDLNFSANGTDAKIVAHDFLDFSSPGQCGKVTISQGNTSSLIANNLTEDAIINITPAQITQPKYWVEIDELGCGRVKIDSGTPVSEDLSFYYMIIKR